MQRFPGHRRLFSSSRAAEFEKCMTTGTGLPRSQIDSIRADVLRSLPAIVPRDVC
jgi:hypothetical protein